MHMQLEGMFRDALQVPILAFLRAVIAIRRNALPAADRVTAVGCDGIPHPNEKFFHGYPSYTTEVR